MSISRHGRDELFPHPLYIRKFEDWKPIILCGGQTLTLLIENASLAFREITVGWRGDSLGSYPLMPLGQMASACQEFSLPLTGHDTNKHRKGRAWTRREIMKVICAGMNKTGTKSITKALRYFGFTVFDWEEQIFDFLDHWFDVFKNGAKPDVLRVYQNADAVVDVPGTFFWEEILEAFPDCKVILSERDEDSWVKSMVNQRETGQAMRSRMSHRTAAILSPTMRKVQYIVDCYFDALLGSRNTKSTYIFRKRYRIHNHRVKSIVSRDKLLVYNVQQGWKPLCDFLGCEVPAVAFPHENIKGEISKMSMSATRTGRQIKCEIHKNLLVAISFVVVIVAASLAIFCYLWLWLMLPFRTDSGSEICSHNFSNENNNNWVTQ